MSTGVDEYICNSTTSLGNGDSVTLTANVTLIITGDLNLIKKITIDSGIYSLDIQVKGNVTIGSGCTIAANISATGVISLGGNFDFTGNLDADGSISLGKGGSFTGDIVAGGDFNLDKNNIIIGNITADGDIGISNNNTITGDIVSGGNIDIANNNIITGDVNANGGAGTLDIGNNSIVNGVCLPFHVRCTGGSNPPLHHFSITPSTTSASTCLANAITIIAEDIANLPVIDYINQIDITISSSHGNWSINNADGALNPVVDNNDDGAIRYTFVVSDASEIILDLSNTHSETLKITVTDSSIPVTYTSTIITFSDNVFVITEDPIQVAGRPQAMNIAMWTNDGSNCFIDTTYNYGPHNLEANIDRAGVLLAATDPTIGAVMIPDTLDIPATASILLDFSVTPGQAIFDLDTTDVGQYTLTFSDISNTHGTSVITGTSNQLTVRPFGIAVTNIMAGTTANLGGTAPDDAIFTTAGSDFGALVAGVLWDATDDIDNNGVLDTGVYTNNSVAPSYAWDTTLSVSAAGFTPATGTPGELINATVLLAEFSGGSFNVNDLQYTEVGSFTLQSQALDYLGDINADIVGDDIIIGRFIPSFFQITSTENGLLANACTIVVNPSVTNPFTYIGETFLYDSVHPSFEISAMNALAIPTVTQNYTGLLWAKLDDDSITFTQPTSDSSQVGSDGTTLMSLSYTQDAAKFNITDNGDGTFNFEFANDQFVYVRDANSDISLFNSDINLIITDVTDLDSVTNSGTFTLSPSSIELRFGRIRMSNVYGSELTDLAMPMIVEYLISPGVYTIHTDDFCTTVTDAHLVVMPNLTGPGSSLVTVINPMADAGALNVRLTSPGSGTVGDINVKANLDLSIDKWLRWDWNVTGLFDDDPDATATFGIFSGNPVQIYIQQTYQ